MYALFDLDDTLHDKRASLRACAAAIYQKFLEGSQIQKDVFTDRFIEENCILQPKTKTFENIARQLSIQPGVQEAMLEYFDSSFHLHAKSCTGVYESLNFLKEQNVVMACVTNGRDFFQKNKIKALGLDSYFSAVVTSGAISIKKPDTAIFITAINQLGAKASDCVFIGDNLKEDMAPAKSLGMKTIWVNKSTDEVPDYVDVQLQSFSQFPKKWRQTLRQS